MNSDRILKLTIKLLLIFLILFGLFNLFWIIYYLINPSLWSIYYLVIFSITFYLIPINLRYLKKFRNN